MTHQNNPKSFFFGSASLALLETVFLNPMVLDPIVAGFFAAAPGMVLFLRAGTLAIVCCEFFRAENALEEGFCAFFAASAFALFASMSFFLASCFFLISSALTLGPNPPRATVRGACAAYRREAFVVVVVVNVVPVKPMRRVRRRQSRTPMATPDASSNSCVRMRVTTTTSVARRRTTRGRSNHHRRHRRDLPCGARACVSRRRCCDDASRSRGCRAQCSPRTVA